MRPHGLGSWVFAQERIVGVENRSSILSASRLEGLGNAFLEAMAVGFADCWHSGWRNSGFLHDGETGFCRVNDPKDIAEKFSVLWMVQNWQSD